jgi:hypothetical protein
VEVELDMIVEIGTETGEEPKSWPGRLMKQEHYNTGLNCRSAGESIIRYTPPDSIGIIS